MCIRDSIRNRIKDRPAVVVLAADNDGKVPFVVAVSSAAVDKGIAAGKLVSLFGGYVGGKGGGKPDLAQGSGNLAAGINQGFAAVREEISQI